MICLHDVIGYIHQKQYGGIAQRRERLPVKQEEAGLSPVAAARKYNLRKGDPVHVYETEITFQKGKQHLKIAGTSKSPQKVRLLL